MFSPLAFPAGMIVYDFTTSLPPPSHLSLSPFELHREPLAIVAVTDGKELGHMPYIESKRLSNGHRPSSVHDFNIRELDQELEAIRDEYPKALVHQLLIFDYVHGIQSAKLPEGLISVPPIEDSKITTMKTIMCDISSMLLAEMTTLARSLQGLTMIESPNKGQGARATNGYSWPTADDVLSQRHSRYMSDSRNESPAGSRDRGNVRMSMPAQLRHASGDINVLSPSSRPATPTDGSQIELENRSGTGTPSAMSPERKALSRVNSGNYREHSRDRISVQGFGSGSLSERSRTKGRGRVSIAIGSLYLQAGRWGDALRELVDGAYIAQQNSDHLWHGKALENIVVAMLMLGWAGLDFQIPQMCYMSAEKAPYHTPTPNTPDQSGRTNNLLASLQNLGALLPALAEMILNKYTRITGESLPQLALSEIIIRFSKLLTFLHLAGGKLDDQLLQVVVQGVQFAEPPNVEIPRLNILPTRVSIVTLLFKAFPSQTSTDDLSVIDRTIILGGIASVLGSLGYYRKKAMVMRELVSILIPGLIQARKVGAAEMGIHPAAGLAALQAVNGSLSGAGAFELGEGDIENGVDDLLSVMCSIYGIVGFESLPKRTMTQQAVGECDDSDGPTVSRIMNNATMRGFGGQNLKMNVLRACINLAEALPDFQGVLRFSSDLLRTAGSGIAPGPRSEDAFPSIAREEQVRLATNITRTVSAASKMGLQYLEAEYWDEFLVRGVDLEPQPPSRTPIPHQKRELSGRTATSESRERNPFIYNPFLKSPDAAAVQHLLVAEEHAIFKVTLQNPYEIDVEIESIKLESDGVDFDSSIQNTVIGPYRTQIMSIYGTPKAPGSLTIKGCLVKVRGCRERRFPIFPESWSPKNDIKIKAVGLAAVRKDSLRPMSVESASKVSASDAVAPKPTALELSVIDRQPLVIVKSSTSSQSAAMVLEGECQTFSITLQNLSSTIPTDLILFSFQDSTLGPLQTALSNREASAAELYEYELILSRKQALRWVKQGDERPYIEPGGTATFIFETLGKPGLTGGVIQVDYAHIGVPINEVQQSFYTRQVTFPLTMTVNASVELARMDVLPLAGNVPGHTWPSRYMDVSPEETIRADDYCFLMLDLRNAWPSQLHVHLEVDGGRSIDEDILPGSTSRTIIPFRRILLGNPHAPIPALDPSRQRQFVVSTGKISADSERATREAFWYREEILKSLKGTWRTVSGQERSGTIELRGIRLSPRMVEAIRIEEIDIQLHVQGASQINEKSDYQASVDEFVTLTAHVTNKTSRPIYPMLRLQPSLRNHAHNLSLDLSRKLVWDGTLQHALPLLPAHGEIEVTIGMAALCRGDFEVGASVEEARLWDDVSDSDLKSKEKEGHEETKVGRQRANTGAMMDPVLGVRERRIWHTREPCVLVVRGEDGSDDE
jgi:hypothetical protein